MEVSFDPAASLVRRLDDPPARGGELVIGHMQLGCPLDHLHLEPVPGCAKLFLCPSPLLDQARILKGRRGLIRSQREQRLFDRGRKVAAFACGGDQSAVAGDPNWEGNRAERF